MTNTEAYFINNLNILEDISPSTNGFGKLFVSNENYSFSYNGYIKDGQLDNYGLIIYTYNKMNPTIQKYEGELSLDKYNGKGKITYTNGDIFIGSFKENMRHGYGKLYDQMGNIIIENKWTNDIIYNKIKYSERFTGTSIIKLEGYLLNSVKIGQWIYYRDDTTIDKIEYYKSYDENIDTNIVELLESSITTNLGNYIRCQKLDINKKLTNIELIKYKYYNNKLINSSTVDQLQKISVKEKKELDYYYIQLDNSGKIISITNTYYNQLIIYLPNKKYLIKDDDNIGIYELINNELIINYTGDLNKNNLPHGNGTIYFNQKKKYQGIFFNGQLKSGLLFTIEEPYSIIYNGSFNNNIPDGNGIYYCNNKKIYEGEIINNKYHGYGVSYWDTTPAKRWEGKWHNGLKHGEGYLYDQNDQLICHCICENDHVIDIL